MIGRQSFAVAGPSLWNSLSAALRRPEMTLHTFKRQLRLMNRRNIRHRPALLWSLCDSTAACKTPDLLRPTYLLSYSEMKGDN